MSQMRLWLLAALAVPGCAQAFDLTPDNTRYLSDPSFLPLAGQVHGETTYGYSSTSEDKYGPKGALLQHEATGQNTVTQELGYGITDRLSVRVTDSYESRRVKDTYTGATYDFRYEGFVDPTIGTTFRAIQQSSLPVSLDLSASYSPDVITRKGAYVYPANGQPAVIGTVARGGQAEELGLAVSREMKSLTVQGYANATYYGQQNEQLQSGNPSNVYTSNWEFGAGLKTETRLTDWWFVNAGAEVSQEDGYTVNNPSQNTSTRVSSRPNGLLYISPGYNVIPNRLALSVEYDRHELGDQSLTGPSGKSDKIKNASEDYYGVHARFLFF